jgi:hypothetical protein
MEALAGAFRSRGDRPELVELEPPTEPVATRRLAAEVVVVDSYRHRADADTIQARVDAYWAEFE